MADVLNLNRFRKRKKREAEQTQADRNAVAHGRTRAERDAIRAEQALERARLEGNRREGVSAPKDTAQPPHADEPADAFSDETQAETPDETPDPSP